MEAVFPEIVLFTSLKIGEMSAHEQNITPAPCGAELPAMTFLIISGLFL